MTGPQGGSGGDTGCWWGWELPGALLLGPRTPDNQAMAASGTLALSRESGEQAGAGNPSPGHCFNVGGHYGFTNSSDIQEDVFVRQTAMKRNHPRKFCAAGDGETVALEGEEVQKLLM